MISRHFEFTYVTTVRGEREGTQVWIPLPSSDLHQEISDLSVGPVAGERTIEPREGNRLLFIDLPPSEAESKIVMTCQVERRRRESAAPPDVPYAPSLAAARHLLSDARVPTDGRFEDEASAVIDAGATPLQKARAVFDHVLETYSYDSSGCTPEKGDAIGDLHVACDLKTGTCTDLHGLMISFLRVLGVPARFAFGFNVPDRPEGRIAGYHCWAEILLPVVGWFPVDVSEARKRDPGPARQFFFGSLDENRVQFSWGRDLTLSPPQRGGPVDKLIFPIAESGGRKVVPHPEFSFRALRVEEPKI